MEYMYGNDGMMELSLKDFVKYIVIRVDLFESEIIDEQNFDAEDIFGIMKFKHKYIRNDYCMIVEVEM